MTRETSKKRAGMKAKKPVKRPAKAWTPTPEQVREFNEQPPCPRHYINCRGRKGHLDCPHKTVPRPATKVTTWLGWGFVLENGGIACHGNLAEVASTAKACGGKLVRVEARLTEVEGQCRSW